MKGLNKFLIFISILAIIFMIGCKKNEFEDYKYLNDDNHVFEKVDYDELMEIINSDKGSIIYFGGSWCINCQAAIPFINEVAKMMYIEKIYNFDTKIDFDGEVRDIRRCNTEEDIKMWSNIVNTIGYSSGSVVKKEDVIVLDADGKELSTMPVPTIVVIKDGKVVTSLTKEGFYNPESNTLWDSNTFDGDDITSLYKTELMSLFTVFDGCENNECAAN